MRKVIGIGETVLDIIFKGGQPVSAVPQSASGSRSAIFFRIFLIVLSSL